MRSSARMDLQKLVYGLLGRYGWLVVSSRTTSRTSLRAVSTIACIG
jgi:hypothetical protein